MKDGSQRRSHNKLEGWGGVVQWGKASGENTWDCGRILGTMDLKKNEELHSNESTLDLLLNYPDLTGKYYYIFNGS